jgi:hypothetical protein
LKNIFLFFKIATRAEGTMDKLLGKNWPMLIILALVIIALSMASRISSSNLPGKGLQFTTLFKVPMESAADNASQALKMTAGGKPVDKPFLSTIVIRNTGNIPIKKEDYDTPIMVSVSNDSSIVQVRYQMAPPEINAELTVSPKKATLSPALLNPEDQVTIQVFSAGGRPEFEMGARIKGVKVLHSETIYAEHPWGKLGILDNVMFTLMLFYIIIFSLAICNSYNSNYIVLRQRTSVVVFISMCVVALYTYFDMKVSDYSIIYSSRTMLAGCAIVAFVVAWSVFRLMDKEN